MFNKTEHILDEELRLDLGLGLCTVCGGAEASLPSHCPGVRMTLEQQEQVQYDQLNFVNGKWIELKPRVYGGPK